MYIANIMNLITTDRMLLPPGLIYYTDNLSKQNREDHPHLFAPREGGVSALRADKQAVGSQAQGKRDGKARRARRSRG